MTTPPPNNPPTTAQQTAQDIQSIISDVAVAGTIITKANVWTAIIGFFTALPGIVNLMLQFVQWFNKVSGNNPAAFIAKNGPIFAQLFNAQTEADRETAAQNIANAIRRLPS